MIEFFRLCPELVEGFVLAPNKDLAVSFWHFCQTSPCGLRNLSVLASLFAPRVLLQAAVSRYYFNLFYRVGVRTFLQWLAPPAITHLAKTTLY